MTEAQLKHAIEDIIHSADYKRQIDNLAAKNSEAQRDIFQLASTYCILKSTDRQEGIAQDIHTSADETTELTKQIRTLTRRMLVLTFIAVEMAIASAFFALSAVQHAQ